MLDCIAHTQNTSKSSPASSLAFIRALTPDTAYADLNTVLFPTKVMSHVCRKPFAPSFESFGAVKSPEADVSVEVKSADDKSR